MAEGERSMRKAAQAVQSYKQFGESCKLEDTLGTIKEAFSPTGSAVKRSEGDRRDTLSMGESNAQFMSKDLGSATQKTSSSTNRRKLKLKNLLKDAKWKQALSAEFEQDYFVELEEKLDAEYAAKKEIFPPRNLIFNAFHLTPLDEVKVVILGQDPYHDNGQAMGLSFSVPKDIPVPGSLKNIYKELERDPKIRNFRAPDHGCLEAWARRGVLMINATLTVKAHEANSHAKFGWQKFTDNVIKTISDKCDHVVFILWGGFAHKKKKLIDDGKHAVVATAHPSPQSASMFKNCNCFSDCNKELKKRKLSAVDWTLPLV